MSQQIFVVTVTSANFAQTIKTVFVPTWVAVRNPTNGTVYVQYGQEQTPSSNAAQWSANTYFALPLSPTGSAASFCSVFVVGASVGDEVTVIVSEVPLLGLSPGNTGAIVTTVVNDVTVDSITSPITVESITGAVTVDSITNAVISTINNATDNAANTQPGQGSYDIAAYPSATFSDTQSWDLAAGESLNVIFSQDVLSAENYMKGIQLQLYDVSFLGLGGAPEYATCTLTYILLLNGSQVIDTINVQEVASSSSPTTLPNVFSFNVSLLDGIANNGLSVQIVYYLTTPDYTWSGGYTQTANIGGVIIESTSTPPSIVGVIT